MKLDLNPSRPKSGARASSSPAFINSLPPAADSAFDISLGLFLQWSKRLIDFLRPRDVRKVARARAHGTGGFFTFAFHELGIHQPECRFDHSPWWGLGSIFLRSSRILQTSDSANHWAISKRFLFWSEDTSLSRFQRHVHAHQKGLQVRVKIH